jgi:hypothetical protein
MRSGGRGRRSSAGLLLISIAVLLAIPTASAAAATYRFRILSASQSYSVTASRGTVSGHREFSGMTTGAVPDDPADSFTTGAGQLGAISTRSSTTNTSPTVGNFFNDYIDNSAGSSPCHHDYGTTASNGGSISITIFDIGDPSKVKISASFGPPGVGDVTNGACGGPIDVHFPYDEPSATVSTATLFSGNPVDLTVTGAKQFDKDILGNAASVTVAYDIDMRVQALGDDLRIDPLAATNEDQGPPSGKWLPQIPVTWKDKGCTDPKEGTQTPRAYLIAGPKRSALASLLGTKEESLAGAAGFAGKSLKLKQGISTVTPTTVGANGIRWQKAIDKAHEKPKPPKESTVSPGRGVFYGGRIACKLPSKPGQFTVAKSQTFTLCHNRSSLSGDAWSKLAPEMRAALGQLWDVLKPLHACYSPSSGFRSQKEQDALRDRWHGIADRDAGDKRSAAEVNAALDAAGLAQDPQGYFGADKSGKRVAKGGPAIYSNHSLGIAADVHVEFSDTGEFEENLAKLQAAAAQVGLCGPPSNDKVHVELPFIAGRDPKTGFPTVESLVPKDGKEPKCSAFTDVKPPKPEAKAPADQNPLKGVTVKATAPAGGTMSAGGSMSRGGGKRLRALPSLLIDGRSDQAPANFRLLPALKRFKAGQTVGLKLRLPKRTKPAVAAALRHGADLEAKVVVTADYGGKRARSSLTIPLG